MIVVLVALAWLAVGIPLAALVARATARDYRPEKMDVSPGLAALVTLAMAPLVALFALAWAVQRPITRWALASIAKSDHRATPGEPGKGGTD